MNHLTASGWSTAPFCPAQLCVGMCRGKVSRSHGGVYLARQTVSNQYKSSWNGCVIVTYLAVGCMNLHIGSRIPTFDEPTCLVRVEMFLWLVNVSCGPLRGLLLYLLAGLEVFPEVPLQPEPLALSMRSSEFVSSSRSRRRLLRGSCCVTSVSDRTGLDTLVLRRPPWL